MSEGTGVQIGSSQMKRVDLVERRKQIGVALGQEKLRKYWDFLKRFTQFKLSKEELDVKAKEILGTENVPLHNDLIRGIFQNALLGTLDPTTQQNLPLAILDPLDPRPTKKPKKKVGPAGNVIVSGGQQGAVSKAGSTAKRLADKTGMSHDLIWLNAQEMHRMQWRICDGGDLYDESLELPSKVGLRHKMRKRCQEHSLSVSQDAVEALHGTLEQYLKNIISACQLVAEMRRGGNNKVGEDQASITQEDFAVAMALQPELMGQEKAMNQERMVLFQHW